MSAIENKYGMFAAPSGARTAVSVEDIDAFVKENHVRLLTRADVKQKAKLLRSYHRAKPGTENYLRAFIADFADDPHFADTIAIYRQKLRDYRRAKNQAAMDALRPAPQPKAEALKLSKQQQALLDLFRTLRRCVNNAATKPTLSWHPRHKEYYYLAKLHILWQRYEQTYGPVDVSNLSNTIAEEVAEERRQTVISQALEAQQALGSETSNSTLAKQRQNIEEQRTTALAEITSLKPQLLAHASDLIIFAQQPASRNLLDTFTSAIEEVTRAGRSLTSSPALFNKAAGSRQPEHAMATLEQVDQLREMQHFQRLFEHEAHQIAAQTALEV